MNAIAAVTLREAEESVYNRQAIANGRRHKAEGFYVFYWYVVVWAVKSVLSFMATAITLS
ncbi:MAG: hypothetical protein AB1589_34540 [Cyanobacteriota bacterium]